MVSYHEILFFFLHGPSSLRPDYTGLRACWQRHSAPAALVLRPPIVLQQALKKAGRTMTTLTTPLPWQGTMAGFRRFSVAEYHKLIEIGMLTEDDNLELIEGYLVHKLRRTPPHDATIQLTMKTLLCNLPSGWDLRVLSAITLTTSEPEPDGAIVRGDARTYSSHHPGPAEVGLVIEVADTTLTGDRIDKGRIYAEAGIPCYWIINLVDRQIEVYTAPSGASAAPVYAQRQDFHAADDVTLSLDGATVATIPVADLLP
jgi:Uma2 family endonuclease